MTKRDRLSNVESEHAKSVRRLKEVVTEKRRLRDQPAKAKADPDGTAAGAKTRVADDQGGTSEPWPNWADERADPVP